ncbi:MAG: DEAD/DEAH box helicase [Nitrososphaeria archaeon]
MPLFKCPLCKKELVLEKDVNRTKFYCYECNYMFSYNDGRVEKAYLKLMLEYDRIGNGIREKFALKAEEKPTRTLDEIKMLLKKYGVNFDELNPAIKAILQEKRANIVKYELFPEKMPEEGDDVERVVGKEIGEWIRRHFFEKFFKFQVEAIKKILDGKNVVLSAPTGSGKTEAFSIPIFIIAKKLLDEVGDKGIGKPVILLIYPTKALARDQRARLKNLAEGFGFNIEVFDGDTTRREREKIFDNPPEALITNFDTINIHLLSNTRYSNLFKKAKIIVVDEVHNYIGSFGAHVHYIVKRLERFTGPLQIIASSATIYNPKEFCEKLFDRPFEVIHEIEGRHGRTHFIMLYPTISTNRILRTNALKTLVKNGFKVLSFSNSHIDAEILLRYARREGLNVRIHRAGLTREFRENVEQAFKRGEIDAIVATPTLELGIDIGHVDAIISDIVNITHLTQRAGRAGRRGQESIILLVLREDDPISSYYSRHPEDYFKDISACYTDPMNPIVREKQILCTICDKPLDFDEELHDEEVADKLVSEKKAFYSKNKVYPTKEGKKNALETNIRGAGKVIEIYCEGKNIGFREIPVGIGELHPKAIYMHGGENYMCKELKVFGEKWVAQVEKLPQDYPYYTKPLTTVEPTVIRVNEIKNVFGIKIAFCDLKIVKSVTGYMQFKMGESEERGEQFILEQPIEYSFETKGFVFRAPEPENLLNKVMETGGRVDELLASSFHATEHVIIEGSNMITGGASNEMGGVSVGTTGMIYVYDGSEGGNGASKLLFDRIEKALTRGQKILEECPCESESGCPRCTYSYHCGNNNRMLHKKGALEVITRILAGISTEPDYSLYDKTIV